MLCLWAFVYLSASWAFFASALPAHTSSIDWVDCSKNVPAAATNLNTTGVNLSALPQTLHCGRIVVPMDYSKPIGVSNNITLGLAMYRPAKPKGALFFCPGGTDPGAAAAWRIALNQTSNFLPDFSGVTEFDIMVMDIRGTWSSNPLNASLETVLPLGGPYPTTQKEFDTFHAASATLIKSITESSTPPGIVQYTGTREVVQDYDLIREALGYDKIHFLGASYGSYRAAQYANTFPNRVGHFVLDSVVPHGLSLYEQGLMAFAAANRGLLRADAYCQNDADCPFRSRGKGSIPNVYSQILTAAQKSTSITPWDVKSLVFNELTGQPSFPQLFQQFEAALSGKTNTPSSAGGQSLEIVQAIPYLCSDNRIYDNTFSAFQAAINAASKVDPYKIGQSLALQIRLFCSAWPYATAPNEPLSLEAPMLLVTADFEVDAPTEMTTFTWKQARNSTLVVRHGDDHVSFNLPKVDSTAIEKEFLRTGVRPCVRDEVLVTVYHPGMQRNPIPDPYDVPTGLIAGDCADADVCNLS